MSITQRKSREDHGSTENGFVFRPLGTRPTWRQTSIFVGKLAISGGLVYFLSRKIDLDQFGSVLSSVDQPLILTAMAVLGLQMAIHAGIWPLILRAAGVQLATAKAVGILLFSLFLNQGLPAALGGIGGRVYYTRLASAPLQNTVTAVIAERVLFLIVLILVSAATLLPFHGIVSGPEITLYTYIVVGLILGLGLSMALAHHIDRMWNGVPILRKVLAALSNVWKVFWDPKRMAHGVLLMLIYHMLSLVALATIAKATGVTTPWTTLVIVFPHVLLIAALPISINGWGVRELTMVTLLGFVDVSPEEALVVSLAFGIAILVTRLPMAVFWFAARPDPKRA